MTIFSTTPTFDKQFQRLDRRQQGVVLKKMRKIVLQPELGKPLRVPLQDRKSERIENLRLIYGHARGHVTFLYFDDRGHVYG